MSKLHAVSSSSSSMMEFFLENPLSCFGDAFPCQREDDADNDNDEGLCSLFLMEKDHMPCGNYVTSLKNGNFDISIRRDAISSISQLSSKFDPLLQYLAVNYLDRYLSSQGSVSVKPPWASRLLAVSCLSLAVKMLEEELPISLIQGNGGLVYDSWTVRRVEVLILGALGWRMRSVTPFSFISFFISLFKMKDPPFRQLLRERATEIILKAQNDVELLRFKPSIVMASALLSASHELFPVQFQCFMAAILACSYVNKEELRECYGAMQGVATEGYKSVLLDDDNDSSGADAPMNVLDHQFSCSCSTSIGNSCGDTTTTTNCMAMSSSSSSWSSTPSTNRHLKRRKIYL